MRISDWSSDVCSSDLLDLAQATEDRRMVDSDAGGGPGEAPRVGDGLDQPEIVPGQGLEGIAHQPAPPMGTGARGLASPVPGLDRPAARGWAFLPVRAERSAGFTAQAPSTTRICASAASARKAGDSPPPLEPQRVAG